MNKKANPKIPKTQIPKMQRLFSIKESALISEDQRHQRSKVLNSEEPSPHHALKLRRDSTIPSTSNTLLTL